MGLHRGTITFRRYQVAGELPEGFRETFLAAIQRKAHREINLESDEDRSCGWTIVGDVVDTNLDFDRIFFTDTISLGFRVDTLRIPAPLLRVYVRKAEQEFLAQMGKEKLAKVDRDEVKDHVMKSLRRRVLPGIQDVDMVWNLDDQIVRFWSHGKTNCMLFEELFRQTFNLRLIPRTPFTALQTLSIPLDTFDGVLTLSPADFVGLEVREKKVA